MTLNFDAINHLLGWSAQAAAPAAPGGFPPQLIIMFGVIGILFYFLMLRPQKQEQKRREQMLGSIAKGDQVVSAGGIHGIVESVDKEKNVVTVAVAKNVSLVFSRGSIANVVKKDGKESAAGGAR